VSFTGSDFLTFAQNLVLGSPTEAELRNAISRAYYAAFLRAREYCWHKGDIVDQTGRAHEQVRRNLQRRGQRHLAADLLNLHLLRKNADYDITFPKPDLSAEANAAEQLAAMVIAAIDALP